jgi:hypothetical protein
MDLIDKYFKLIGPKLDTQVMKYMGFDQEKQWELELRLGDMLGQEGIDNIIKDITKGIVEITEGGYHLRVKFTNWDIYKINVGDRPHQTVSNWTLDNIEVLVDPKSTVEVIGGNGHEYELGDLYNYSDIDELNANYNTEDNPITEDDISEIGYEVQDVIDGWLTKQIWPLTGIEVGDIYPNNARHFDLKEQNHKYLKTKMNVVESIKRISDLMTDKPIKN